MPLLAFDHENSECENQRFGLKTLTIFEIPARVAGIFFGAWGLLALFLQAVPELEIRDSLR